MIDAKEAKRITQECIKSNLKHELSIIEEEIMKCVAKGKYECHLNAISSGVKDRLTSLGYTVNTGVQYNQEYNVISWKNN